MTHTQLLRVLVKLQATKHFFPSCSISFSQRVLAQQPIRIKVVLAPNKVQLPRTHPHGHRLHPGGERPLQRRHSPCLHLSLTCLLHLPHCQRQCTAERWRIASLSNPLVVHSLCLRWEWRYQAKKSRHWVRSRERFWICRVILFSSLEEKMTQVISRWQIDV